MGITSIEWTDRTWNPVRGCSRVSEGCRYCYAERQAARFSGPGKPFEGLVQIVNGHPAWTGKVELVEKHLEDPLHWRKPAWVFVNSMSDLFHEKLPRVEIARTYAVMAYCQWHEFQVLTKRPEVRYAYCGLEADVRELLQSLLQKYGPPPHPKPFRWPLSNVWEGVSVEDQKTADERIPLLLQTPAAIRFVSYEPALGPVDFHRIADGRGFTFDALSRKGGIAFREGVGLDWVIVGGESGPNARPFDIAWARNTIAQCRAAGVACFVKQLGSHPFDVPRYRQEHPWPDSVEWINATEPSLRDRKGGDMEEWPEDVRVREFPAYDRTAEQSGTQSLRARAPGGHRTAKTL